MTKEKLIIYPEEGKLCMGCFHQRCSHRYDLGQFNNRLLCVIQNASVFNL